MEPIRYHIIFKNSLAFFKTEHSEQLKIYRKNAVEAELRRREEEDKEQQKQGSPPIKRKSQYPVFTDDEVILQLPEDDEYRPFLVKGNKVVEDYTATNDKAAKNFLAIVVGLVDANGEEQVKAALAAITNIPFFTSSGQPPVDHYTKTRPAKITAFARATKNKSLEIWEVYGIGFHKSNAKEPKKNEPSQYTMDHYFQPDNAPDVAMIGAKSKFGKKDTITLGYKGD